MKLLSCILVASFIAAVIGHGVMIIPTPLNTNPTTSAPCGVTTLPTTPTAAATWGAGNTVTIEWQLIASDGGSSVEGIIDPSGVGKTANFVVGGTGSTAVQVWTGSQFPIGPSLTTYTATITVPKVTCANGLCLLRMVTNTGWNSCTYVNITDCNGCPTQGPAPPKCTDLPDLNFCADQSNLEAYLAADADPTVVDQDTKNVFFSNLNKTTVFSNGGDETCRRAYQVFMCGLNFPPCPGSGTLTPVSDACRSKCDTAMNACGLTTEHAGLYDCSTLPPCPGDRSPASSVAVGVAAVVASAAVALL